MSEEEIINILKNFRNYNKFYKEEDGNLTITIDYESKDIINKAIEKLLDLYKAEKRKSKIKHEYLKLIYELGVDYDGCEKAESLKDLIDELVGIAVKGMENDDKSIIYEGMTPKNILLEDLEEKDE